jgi:hypothetical protein
MRSSYFEARFRGSYVGRRSETCLSVSEDDYSLIYLISFSTIGSAVDIQMEVSHAILIIGIPGLFFLLPLMADPFDGRYCDRKTSK